MKVNKQDGTTVEIELKRKHTKQLMKSFSKLTGSEEDMAKGLAEYQALLDTIAIETTGISEEQFDDLDSEDANTILNAIQTSSLGQLDFLKSSLK